MNVTSFPIKMCCILWTQKESYRLVITCNGGKSKARCHVMPQKDCACLFKASYTRQSYMRRLWIKRLTPYTDGAEISVSFCSSLNTFSRAQSWWEGETVHVFRDQNFLPTRQNILNLTPDWPSWWNSCMGWSMQSTFQILTVLSWPPVTMRLTALPFCNRCSQRIQTSAFNMNQVQGLCRKDLSEVQRLN